MYHRYVGSSIVKINENPISDMASAVSIMNDRELTFLKLCCSEMTYKEIADKMYLSPKTIDGYRANLFEKLDTKSRVGLVLYAVKNGIHVPE